MLDIVSGAKVGLGCGEDSHLIHWDGKTDVLCVGGIGLVRACSFTGDWFNCLLGLVLGDTVVSSILDKLVVSEIFLM